MKNRLHFFLSILLFSFSIHSHANVVKSDSDSLKLSHFEAVVEYFRLTHVAVSGQRDRLDSVAIYHPTLSNLKIIADIKKPNELITISFESMQEVDATIFIYDGNNEIVFGKSMVLSNDYNRKEISLKKLLPGTYRLQVRDEWEEVLSRRLVVH